MPLGAQNLRRIRGSARCTIAVVGRMRGYRIAPGVAKVAGTLPARLEVIVHLPNYLGPGGLGPVCTCVCKEVSEAMRNGWVSAYFGRFCCEVSVAGGELLHSC
jgi:hypothetical protein